MPTICFASMLLLPASALLLFAEGGLLYDYFPYFTPLMDKLGIGLGLTLAVKESAFLLWILAAVLSEKRLLQQLIVLDSLGYSRWQCLNWLLLPSVAPALAMAMLAIVAWSLSVVDVAIILGPGNPPTLAVISWQWLTQGDADQQTLQPHAVQLRRQQLRLSRRGSDVDVWRDLDAGAVGLQPALSSVLALLRCTPSRPLPPSARSLVRGLYRVRPTGDRLSQPSTATR